MSQRLIEARQRRILGITSTGIIIPLICGAEPDDDDNDNTGDGGDGTGSDGTENNGDGTGSDNDGSSSTVDKTEHEKLRARMVAADQRASKAEKALQAISDKDKTELEKAQRDLAELKAKADKAEADLIKSKIHNKFLSSNKHSWHDAETALALLDLSEVTVEEDGKVVGLEDAIEKLAKAKPFLISGEGGKNDSKDDGKKSPANGTPPSGKQPPSNGGQDKKSQERAALLKKYPQLTR